MNWPTPSPGALASPSDSLSFRLLLAGEGFRSFERQAACIPLDEFTDEVEPQTGSRGEFETLPLAWTAAQTQVEAMQALTHLLVELSQRLEPISAAAAHWLSPPLIIGPTVVPAEPPATKPPVPQPGALVSTKGVARYLRVRPERLFALREQALADGVAQPAGSGTRRQHIRWRLDKLEDWWRSQTTKGQRRRAGEDQ